MSKLKEDTMAIKTAEQEIEETTLNYETLEVAKIGALAADDKKATDIVILDVKDLTSFADYFVICSAPSERQVQAIIRNIEDELRKRKIRALGVEGLETSSWVLLDFGDVIFHCFTDAAREYYDLEGFWIDAERIKFQ